MGVHPRGCAFLHRFEERAVVSSLPDWPPAARYFGFLSVIHDGDL